MPHLKPILLVEDDSVDVMAVQRALKELHVTNTLVYAANGEEALTYLRGPDNQMPCVILLDLNMPKMNGLEFLEIVKADETLKTIPVAVVTTSGEHQDMKRSLELGTVAYIIKCSDYGEFRESMKSIEIYLAPAQPAHRLTLAPR